MKNEIMKRKKKGFTLVEIIVVLVILAVLAAVTIPSMLGFVDEAKGKTEIANARAAYLAAQMVATEDFAINNTATDTLNYDDLKSRIGSDITDATVAATVVKGKVTDVVFTHGGYTVTMEDVNTATGKVTVVPAPKPD